MAVFDWAAAGKKHRNREKSSSDAETCGKKSPRRGIEPRSGTRQAPILTIKLVGIKINYHLLTSIYVTSILSYTVLEDDANDEK